MLRSLLLLFIPITSFAQFTYKLDQTIPVEIGDYTLGMPWAGGLNSAQINKLDFDGDGNEDVVVFDHSSNMIMPYRNAGGKYEYTPDYSVLFPTAVTDWMLLRDFNCDGKKDLFTSDPFGIVVFVNTTKPGQPLSWRPFNPNPLDPSVPSPLFTKGFNGNINLKINAVDIPAIDDVDNDGDLDILAMRFVGIGTIEYHKNLSIENAGKCDSLQLERITQTYGGVEECTCGVFAFGGQPCNTGGGKIEHVGGKALLNVDVDNDGDKDLLFSEESCNSLFLLENKGDKDNPVFTAAVPYPDPNPSQFQFFPAPYYEDVDFDGVSDLVVSPNLYSRQYDVIITKNSLWFYKNTGSNAQPNFTFTRRNFLQQDIIDVGDYSVPTLMDTDNDGDDDLFIGYYLTEGVRASIQQFENIGTIGEPKFKLVTEDLGGMTNLLLYNYKPQAVDMNGDGKTDLAFTATSLQGGATFLYYVPNVADEGFTPSFSGIVQTEFSIAQTENVYITDVNRDGIPDLLVGKATGALQYLENTSNDGKFGSLTLKNGSYLGIGTSTSRQNPSVVTMDLDADGVEDLIMGDQRGLLSFYADYRNFNSTLSEPSTNTFYNSVLEEYVPTKLGGRVRMAVSNLFNTSRPSIVVGNTLGGLYILRNDNTNVLPDDPVVYIGPNPLDRGEDLLIKSDRNTKVQIFSLLGQKMSEQVPVPANQTYALALKELAAGMYIARFTFTHKKITIKFIIK